MHFGFPAYTYDPAQLGYPHDIAEQQDTEPFWYQHDLVHQFSQPLHLNPTFGYTHYNYIYDPFTTMQDFVPIFIGSNTANRKILKGDEAKKSKKPRVDKLMKLSGKALLQIGDIVVGNANVQELIRFSRAVGAKFTKPKEGQTVAAGPTELGFTVDVFRSADGDRTVRFTNDYSKIWALPEAWAFAEILGWMYSMHHLPRSVELPHFRIENENAWTLHELVDVYAASLILDVRPKAVMSLFRGVVIRKLAHVPATAQDFEYLHHRIPVGDVVLRKMVETFFVHGERNHYRNWRLKGEVTRIKEYVNGCGDEAFNELVCRFQEGRMEDRKAKLQEAKERGVAVKGQGQGTGIGGKADGKVKGCMAQGTAQGTPAKGKGKDTTAAGSASPKDSAMGSPTPASTKV